MTSVINSFLALIEISRSIGSLSSCSPSIDESGEIMPLLTLPAQSIIPYLSLGRRVSGTAMFFGAYRDDIFASSTAKDGGIKQNSKKSIHANKK